VGSLVFGEDILKVLWLFLIKVVFMIKLLHGELGQCCPISLNLLGDHMLLS
jgi:hypothetical protein